MTDESDLLRRLIEDKLEEELVRAVSWPQGRSVALINRPDDWGALRNQGRDLMSSGRPTNTALNTRRVAEKVAEEVLADLKRLGAQVVRLYVPGPRGENDD